MHNFRVIPCLLIDDRNLIKTKKFKNPTYIGDPINAVRIFNEKEVDEIIVLDRSARDKSCNPDFEFIKEIASECFMPFAYGGGITNIDQVRILFDIGVEKVVINTSIFSNPEFVKEAVDVFGSQAITASIDVRKKAFGRYDVVSACGNWSSGRDPVSVAKYVQGLGVGEIFLTSIDAEGTMGGYDLELIAKVATNVNVPVIASGGAGHLSDFRAAVHNSKASAVAASSMFVFHGKHRAVLINYPTYNKLKDLFEKERECD